MTLRRKRDLAWQQIGAELVVMSLSEKKVLGLNPAGAFLWSLIEERDEDGLVSALVERFATDERQARSDVRGFVSMLRERGLVSEAQ
jgi:coenzyme PQQ synthesis protein D (PqqD)